MEDLFSDVELAVQGLRLHLPSGTQKGAKSHDWPND